MKLFETIQKYNYDLDIDHDLHYSADQITAIRTFIGFCFKELGLSKRCTIKLVSNREANGIKTTAYWNEASQTACVYANKRMLIDVMRSLAHELVHKQQLEKGTVTFPVQDIGGEIEDEANAMAGVIVKKFINFNPHSAFLIENRNFSN